MRTEDAEMLTLILTTLDLADDEGLSRFARLYGGTVQRLITAGLQFFDRTVYQRALTFDMSNEEQDEFVYQRGRGVHAARGAGRSAPAAAAP